MIQFHERNFNLLNIRHIEADPKVYVHLYRSPNINMIYVILREINFCESIINFYFGTRFEKI